MKIAFIYDAVYPWVKGGAEKRIFEISRVLAENGHEVHCFGIKWWKGKNVIKFNGVYLHGVCPRQCLYIKGKRSIKEALYFGWKVLLPLIKDKYDIIECQNFPYFSCYSAKFASFVNGSRLVIAWHEYWGKYWFEYIGWKGVFGVITEYLATRLTKDIITVSNYTKKRLIIWGVPESVIKVIPNGVDLNNIRAVNKQSISSDIIFVGRLIKEKNVGLLLDVIKELAMKRHNLSVSIIGDGPERVNLEYRCKTMNLEGKVTFFGFLNNKDEIFSRMKSSKIFILTSEREGFGIVVLEANVCGLPVIVVRGKYNAAVDLVVDGKNGYVCEKNATDIAKKSNYLLNNEEQRKKISTISENYWNNHYWDKIVNTTEKFYSSLL